MKLLLLFFRFLGKAWWAVTLDQAIEEIIATKPGDAVSVALKCIEQLSQDDQLLAGGDLLSMAILIDEGD